GRAVGGVQDIAGNFLRRRALLFHGGRDGRGDRGDAGDRGADFLDGGNRVAGGRLHTGNVGADLFGGLGGLGGERLHFGRRPGEAAAGFAGAGCLDGRIERQQIGLLGDRRDQLHHVADAARRHRQFGDARVGRGRLLYRRPGNGLGFVHLPADLADGSGELLGRRGHRLHAAGGFFRRLGNGRRHTLGGVGRMGQAL